MTIRNFVSTRLLLLFLVGVAPIYAVNALHDARFQLLPQPPSSDRFELYGGLNTYGQNQGFAIPVGVAMGVNDFLEIGGRLDFDVYDELVLLLDLGAKIRISKVEAIQFDMRFGEGWGAVVEYSLFHALNRRFSMIYTIPRISFFEGLNGDEPLIVEIGTLPRLRLFRPVDLLLNLTYSTSITSPVRYSAFDIAVGTELKLINHSRLFAMMQFGIAGRHESSDFALRLGLIYEL